MEFIQLSSPKGKVMCFSGQLSQARHVGGGGTGRTSLGGAPWENMNLAPKKNAESPLVIRALDSTTASSHRT